jgi:hypothetical protein
MKIATATSHCRSLRVSAPDEESGKVKARITTAPRKRDPPFSRKFPAMKLEVLIF